MTVNETFDVFEKRLKKLAGPGVCPGLARLSKLLSLVDNPERKFNVVHVVGTNGKGSTSATLSSILMHAGYKVATYTSPHLISFGERLSINNEKVFVSNWMTYLDKIEKIIKLNKSLTENPPTYFEIITAIAFLIIAEEKVDIAVVEAGLGGRLDATNILKNVLLTLVVSIGIDHTEYLGHSLSKIAAEKFAVMRKNTLTIFQGGNDEINQQFLEVAKKSLSIGKILDELCVYETLSVTNKGTDFHVTFNELKHTYHTPLIGFHQTRNATLALMGAEILKKKFQNINQLALHDGICATSCPGRFEIVRESPLLILDGAHNPHAMEMFVKTVKQIFNNKKIFIILAMMDDKDVKKSLLILSKLNSIVICTEIPKMRRSMKADALFKLAQEVGIKALAAYRNPMDAIKYSLLNSEIIISCGSLFLVGYIKKQMILDKYKIENNKK